MLGNLEMHPKDIFGRLEIELSGAQKLILARLSTETELTPLWPTTFIW